ncbi:hypothetical protein KC366_g13489, partial [Hortaea werneckii]
MFSTAGSIGDMATRHHSGSVRRWRNRSTASTTGSGIGSPSTPLHGGGRSNTMKTSSTLNSPTTTTFLPELTSTPPMPTFQKPSLLPSPRQELLTRENKENNLPPHHSFTLTPTP